MPQIFERQNGQVTWTQKKGDYYLVTGVTHPMYGSKRFRRVNACWDFISFCNVWRGSFWLIRDGKRHLIKRVYN